MRDENLKILNIKSTSRDDKIIQNSNTHSTSFSFLPCSTIYSFLLNCFNNLFCIQQNVEIDPNLLINEIYKSTPLAMCLIKIVAEYACEPKADEQKEEIRSSITPYRSVRYYDIPSPVLFKIDPYFNDRYYRQINYEERLHYRS